MRSSICVCIALWILFAAESARAQVTLAYSFETIVAPNGPDGFFGLAATVSQEPTIGVTQGSNSLKYEIGVGGFTGVRTEAVIPAALNDPPGVTSVLFDLTIVTPYGGTFADIGVTVFGHALNAPGGAEFGHQVQFADFVSVGGLTAGTYLDRQIDLDTAVGPYRAGESFNAIFGPEPTDLTVASAFQFFVSKNTDQPLTIYIDNVRLVPEPGMLGGLAVVALGRLRRRRHA